MICFACKHRLKSDLINGEYNTCILPVYLKSIINCVYFELKLTLNIPYLCTAVTLQENFNIPIYYIGYITPIIH